MTEYINGVAVVEGGAPDAHATSHTDGTDDIQESSTSQKGICQLDDTPIDNETNEPITSNWAYDHVDTADPHSGYVLESLFEAHSILYSISDNTPAYITVAASRILGRKASGNIAAMTVAELLTLIGVASGADVTGNNPPQAHEASHVSGGSDDIDSALADVAIPNLATSKITSGQFSLDRIPRGTDTHVLTAKGAGVSPAYEAPAGGAVIATGTYTATDVDDRQITTGFKCSMVILFAEHGNFSFSWILLPDGTFRRDENGTGNTQTDALLHATDGFVVDQVQANVSAAEPYSWWAISE